MQWPSPWGMGFPGWHIECSAMSAKYLGKQFDLHGGGMDLAATHHTNEIAQSQACNHVSPAHIWMHTNMLTVNGTRMSKSAGNGFTPQELFTGNHPLLTKAYHPMAVKFFMLQTHYRSTLDFSNDALQASEKALKRLWQAYDTLVTLHTNAITGSNAELELKILTTLQAIDDNMCDDFNTAKVIACLFDLTGTINALKDAAIALTEISESTLLKLKTYYKAYLEDVLGLQPVTEPGGNKLQAAMQLILDLRRQAKNNKDFATSDTIRNQLSQAGIVVKDHKDGRMEWE